MESHSSQVRAVIDIGTNSCKMLVATVGVPGICPVFETSCQTRLGKDFYETHLLRPEAIEQTAEAVAEFAARAKHYTEVPPRVIATSAARDAINASDLLSAVKASSGLEVEIISGDQEAEWAFRGVAGGEGLAGKRLLIVDVGGGSTEMIVGEGAHFSFQQSFHMGSVRLMEKLSPADPPSEDDLNRCREWLLDFFRREIKPSLKSLLEPSEQLILVGTGGTSTILARMQKKLDKFRRDLIEGTVMTRAEVLEWMVRLWKLPLADRKRIPGLPPNRADIVLMGVAIYEAVMEHFEFEELRVSTRGLRFGAVMA